MTKPTAPYIYKPPPVEAEIGPKVAASETIRAVRVILERSKLPETDSPDTRCCLEPLPSRPAQGEAPDLMPDYN